MGISLLFLGTYGQDLDLLLKVLSPILTILTFILAFVIGGQIEKRKTINQNRIDLEFAEDIHLSIQKELTELRDVIDNQREFFLKLHGRDEKMKLFEQRTDYPTVNIQLFNALPQSKWYELTKTKSGWFKLRAEKKMSRHKYMGLSLAVAGLQKDLTRIFEQNQLLEREKSLRLRKLREALNSLRSIFNTSITYPKYSKQLKAQEKNNPVIVEQLELYLKVAHDNFIDPEIFKSQTADIFLIMECVQKALKQISNWEITHDKVDSIFFSDFDKRLIELQNEMSEFENFVLETCWKLTSTVNLLHKYLIYLNR